MDFLTAVGICCLSSAASLLLVLPTVRRLEKEKDSLEKEREALMKERDFLYLMLTSALKKSQRRWEGEKVFVFVKTPPELP